MGSDHEEARYPASPSDVAAFLVRQINQAEGRQAPVRVNGASDSKEIHMSSDPSKLTLYFDGSCPLCRAEIGLYRRQDQADALCFVDVSAPDAATPQGLTQQQAMQRFHVRAGEGRLLSGATAFVEVWGRLPRWRWAARAAALPGALAVLEWGYRMFLPVRPFVSRVFGRMLRRGAIGDGGKRG